MLAGIMFESPSERMGSHWSCRSVGWIAACAVMLVIAGASCRDNADEARALLEERSRRGFIAFVGTGPGDALWPILRGGGLRYEQDSPIDIRFLNPPADTPQAQVDLLAKLDLLDLRGICIRMNDDVDTVATILSRLQNRGIAIVSMVETAGSRLRLNHVGVDDMEVGEALARCTIEALGEPGGTIMVLHAGSDHPVYGLRHLTFMEQLRKTSRIIVMGDLDCKADPAEARRIIKERTKRYPRLDLWVSMEDWPLANSTPAKEVFGTSTQRYITFGGFPRQWPLIREGRCPYVVAADYGEIAARAAMLCNSDIREPAQEQRNFRVPLRTIAAGNLDAYCRDWATWAAEPTAASSPHE